MPLSDAQKKAQLRYHKKMKTHFGLDFHNINDADVIEKLLNVEGSKTNYIRQLIREDIKRSKKFDE